MTRTHIVVAAGDEHIGSSFGLCPPCVRLDGGGVYRHTLIQAEVWEFWERVWQELDDLKRALDASVTVILNGDVVDDNRHRTSERISSNPADILAAAEEALVWPIVVADRTIMVRGTEAHTGNSGNLEEILAKEIGCEQWPSGNYSGNRFYQTIGGVRVLAQHHPGTASRLPWTMGGAANRTAARILYKFAESGLPIPNLAFFGHTHSAEGSSSNHPVEAVFVPSWKLTDAYSHRFGGDFLPVGLAYAIISNGGYNLVRRSKTWPQLDRWEPI